MDTTVESLNWRSTRTAVVILLAIFLSSLLCLSLVYYNFPNLEPAERTHLKLPKNIEDAKRLGTVLSHYKDKYFLVVLSGFLITYVFLQSFAIPGSIFLSILSGFLFSFPLALFCVCLSSAVGASLCYLLSYLVGRRVVLKFWPNKVKEWAQTVDSHRNNLLNYIIFLRITPFLPNWFINITSPVIDVPLKTFFIGTFLGVAPPSFIAIQAGTTLNTLTSNSGILSMHSVVAIFAMAAFSLIPVFLKNTLQQKIKDV
ncbi:transmembrane protein 41B-like [Oppia nitens]|uniref:transmembrane protein 41B-like n=1 Tax=Oppia nitens TaxID=1686743 RepID=UPI0023DCC3B6|nr:transmembrane protein 41B-like [Oppia nitens]